MNNPTLTETVRPRPDGPIAPAAPRFRRARWWAAAAGVMLGFSDTLFATALGFSFEINGRNATALTAVYFSSSFALLGFLLGYVIEQRRKERHAAAIIQSQLQTIGEARARLAQSEKLAALGQLAAMVAHEVRNPLAVIRSAAQGMGEMLPSGDAEARQASEFITAEIDRLNSVVTSLLTFARPPQLHPRAVAVRDLVDRALLLAREELGAKQLTVERRDAAGVGAVQADPDLMSQVLLCLLSNAAEAAPAGGEIILDTHVTEGAVVIGINDSGPGVPAPLRERIFEPFFTTRARGTGLGLAIARQIVEAHGGRIEVGDGVRRGARFTIRLPGALEPSLAA
jgi:signal transduction histidine kinase